jgi:hypothetical protein
MERAKQNDNRYKFILKVKGDLTQLKEELTLAITRERLITKWFVFDDKTNQQIILLFSLDESRQPLSRKYFQGETCGGANLLKRLDITRIDTEIIHTKYDETIK